MDKNRLISLSRLIRRIALVLGVLCTSAHAQTENLENYRNLQQIAFFSSITASFHSTAAANPDAEARISAESLTQYLRRQFAVHFPGVPYRPADSGTLSGPDSDAAGYLACKIWADSEKKPAVFQVRCQISTTARMNVIDDASFGYAPPEMAPTIIQEQIDHILRGLAATFFRAKGAS